MILLFLGTCKAVACSDSHLVNAVPFGVTQHPVGKSAHAKINVVELACIHKLNAVIIPHAKGQVQSIIDTSAVCRLLVKTSVRLPVVDISAHKRAHAKLLDRQLYDVSFFVVSHILPPFLTLSLLYHLSQRMSIGFVRSKLPYF